MATNSRVAKKESVVSNNKHQGRQILHDKSSKVLTQKGGEAGGEEYDDEMKVPVVYYLSRNGQLEHPHFIQVPLSSSQGLFLKDVISRLNALRGEGIADMYSWSSKRSYRNGYVWQDLTGNDLIHPCHGQEYILKGSPLLETSLSFRYHESASSATPSSSSSSSSSTTSSSILSSISSDTISNSGRYRARTSGELGSFRAIHVSTQTDNDDDDVKMRKRVVGCESTEADADEKVIIGSGRNCGDSVSQSQVEGSEEWVANRSSADIRDRTAENERPSGRFKAAGVLMQLISCGSLRYPA